jgi:hypothetical protein
MEYRHTQTAFQSVVLTVGLMLALITVFVPDLEDEGLLFPIAIFLVVTAAVTLVFSRLTVTVRNGEVVTAFGLGWPRHTELLSEIVAVRKVRNKWIYGWGIRRLPDGWMYNVWGLDAVEVDLVSEKKFRIGTDDPEGLLAAITVSMTPK